MALLRQKGCPTVFLTVSCAEYDWFELLKEIVETVGRTEVSGEYVKSLSSKEKNRLISENYVQSTIHFQKRIDKLFTLMKGEFFKGADENFHIHDYFYRVEFQQRGAPHVHSLLWIQNEKDEEAPSFWYNDPSSDEFDVFDRKI